ncbi:hypothetical protein E3N88_22773 [Mikania micrantha]|uniref:Zinc finger, CCHC-type n=1 Tax=Mikania micrantha TaxID=192012 RepID=A0A5N6NBE1_9ASTR|nr:hypothetical protein E3N88_22773 [Mikania micrantha]
MVQKARLQTLKNEFEMLQMKEEESIDSFTVRLNDIVSKANSLGSTFDQPSLVRKLLNSVPERFIQIVAFIEQFNDLDTMSLDEVIGRLKTFEEKIKSKKPNLVNNLNELLFTNHDNNIGSGQHFDNCEQRRFNPSRGRGRGRFRQERENMSHDNYEKSGRYPRNQSKFMVDIKDEEPTLLMAQVEDDVTQKEFEDMEELVLVGDKGG